MSANQKQAPSAVPQPQQRFNNQGPCYNISQRPPTPQRSDGFHVATQPTFVPQQPPNQANNQVPPLRGMPPTGPPTQASTPPNTDLKYVSQAPVRAPAQNFYSRAPPPSNQTPRMANHRQGQQPLYQTQPTQFVPMALQPPMYHLNTSTPVQYFNGGPRPQASYVAPGYQMIPSQTITYQYPQAPSQPQAAYFYSASQLLQRPPPPVASAPQNPTQPPAPTMSLNQPTQQHGSHTKNKRRSRAIPIIDPNTGKDKLSEMYEQEQDDSHPPSGESSARQTPQPPLPNPNKEVQAAFAKQVAQAIGKDEVSAAEELEQPPILDHVGHTMYQQPPQAVHQRYDTIVQSSKLQAATKEFIPAALSTAKETTPVVSAITDAREVTITNKPKDRESPAKGRKQRDQPTPREREHKDSVKEAAVKDAPVCEKPVSCSKDEIKQKDAVVLNVGPNEDAPATFAREEKKNPKKDKADVKPSPPSSIATSEDNLPDVGLTIPPPVAPLIPENAPSSAKSKHNNASQKSKDVPKQPPPQQASPPLAAPAQKPVQPPPPPVPSTQPSKPTNKTSKLRELNLKGASKEGTDMDAFNDNVVVEDATNANHTTNTSSVNPPSDYLNNANNVMLNNNINIGSSTVTNDSNKKAESNDVPTIKPTEIKPLPKKIDVTDIVKELPKQIKPIVVPTPVESQDEPDRAALANDKMVQAKNEANAKASAEAVDANAETKVNLPYREGQWSPFNKDGKKVYDRDFLMALKKDPKSNKKPENLPADILASEDRGRLGDISRFAVGGRATDFAPNFSSNNYPNKSSSQRGAPPKRKSQQGSIGGSGKGGKQSVIRVSISVKEDVKLHETENAWKPARFVAGAAMTEDEKRTAELYKKVRGVLNKLTPQKFETLLDQVRSLSIDTTERLQGVIDLVFEKAVDEPNFSVAYALLCRELALMQVPATDGKRKEGAEFVNFRKLLVTRCQLEFEKNSVDETERNRRTKEIEDCNDPEKKKDMQLELDEYDRRLRQKSVGNIRFIGELFKQQMLTVNIMLRCLNNLLDTKDEESLECLCKLLTTVGKELETKKVDLGGIFSAMKDIADKKHGRISSRVRFMIQDVIDLRSSRWIPRRQDFNPKTMDQIQKEAEHEQLTIQAMNSVPITPRREERGGGGGGGGVNASADKKRNRNVSNDDGWSTAPSRGSRTPFTVQSDKLKNKAPMMDEPLGSIQMFGNWGRGSNIKTQPPLTNTANMYAALENIGTESDKRPALGLRMNNKDTYSSKSPSLERNYRQSFEEGRGSRSGSQHRSRDSSTASQRNTTPAPVPSAPKAQPSTGAPPVPAPVELTPDQLERRLKNILEEYLNDCCSVQECDQDIKTSISPAALPQLVSDGYISVLERSKTGRLRTGYLFAQLIKLGTLSLQDYCAGLEAVLEEADELIIDIPRVWDYVAELISPVVCECSATFVDLHKSFEPLVSKNHASKLLACLFKLIIQEKGPNFLQSCWNSSGFTLADYMEESQVDSYVKENNFEFLLEAGDASPVSQSHSPLLGQSQLSYEEIHEKLLAFFKPGTSFDDIINWIAANVGERVKENPFIRTLATACFEDSIVNLKLKADILQGKYNLLHRFVDNKPAYELQCLYALQALINKLEHPQGLLLAICDKLYEENVFSHESFVAWEASKDPAEQEGKGVALKQLTSFFTQLKEADEDSSSSEDAA